MRNIFEPFQISKNSQVKSILEALMTNSATINLNWKCFKAVVQAMAWSILIKQWLSPSVQVHRVLNPGMGTR